jgi:hypothetical protein
LRARSTVPGVAARRIAAAGLLLVALVVAGVLTARWLGVGAGVRVAGCTAPEHEEDLLDAYAADPVLAVVPAAAARVGGVDRTRACYQLNREDVSNTLATVEIRLASDPDGAALRGLYDPVATGHGWTADPAWVAGAGPEPGGVLLAYCRTVRGVTSELVLRAQPAQRVDVRSSIGPRPSPPDVRTLAPPSLYVSISADPARAAC